MEPETSGSQSQPVDVSSRIDTTIELVKRLCLAESVDRIYSVDHPKTQEAIRSAYDWITQVMERGGEVPITMAEGKILIDGMPIDERNPMVAKFAHVFHQIHVDNLFFEPGLTYEEFETFFRVLGMGAKQINAHGGFPALLKERGVEHIQIKHISYIMVRDDEKVVSRDAKVSDARAPGAELSDQQLVEYMVREVMRKAEERKWLINEIKNNPRKMASLIAEGIELATSKAETGLSAEQTIESLLENIRMVGQSLVDEKTGDVTNEADLQEAIMTLESEVRARSKKLMSSETAVGFINEVMAVITSFTDQVKAKKISDEILKGERGLKQTERLLKKLLPPDVSGDEYLQRIHALLAQRGVPEQQLEQLAEAAKPKPRKPRKPRVAKPVLETITERLAAAGVDETGREQMAGDLAAFFERELRARARDLQLQNETLTEQLRLRDAVLEQLGPGTAIWNRDGTLHFLDPAARAALGLQPGMSLHPGLLSALSAWSFPIAELPAQTVAEQGWSQAEQQLLLLTDRVLRADDGAVIGAQLRPAPEPA
jgi:PAS domain-containing protein